MVLSDESRSILQNRLKTSRIVVRLFLVVIRKQKHFKPERLTSYQLPKKIDMKNTCISLVVFSLMFTMSCEDSITELNVNPNQFITAHDAQVLTGVLGSLGYIVDVDLNYRSQLWAQYYTWGLGVALGNAERFVAEPYYYNGYWQRAYANCLADLKFLSKSESNAYRGVGGVLEAYIYQGLVDHFGDIPYTEAVLGELEDGGIISPKYDEAADVYADLVIKLDESISLLEKPDNTIGMEDLIYKGDLINWIRFANTLKLRILMRTSETNPQGSPSPT